jgi:hypothetical protein
MAMAVDSSDYDSDATEPYSSSDDDPEDGGDAPSGCPGLSPFNFQARVQAYAREITTPGLIDVAKERFVNKFTVSDEPTDKKAACRRGVIEPFLGTRFVANGYQLELQMTFPFYFRTYKDLARDMQLVPVTDNSGGEGASFADLAVL